MRKLLLGLFFVLAVAGSAFAASADSSIFPGYREVIMTKLPFTPAAGQTVVLAAGAADTIQINSIDIFVDGGSIAVCDISSGKFGQCLKSAGPWYDVGKPHSYYATATTSSGQVLYSKIYDFVLQPASSAQSGISVGAFQEETAYCNVCVSKGAGYDKSKQECEKGTAFGSTESGGATLGRGDWVFYSTEYQKNQIVASNAQLKNSLSCEGLASKASVTSTASSSQTSVVDSCKYQCSAYKYSEGQCYQGWQCVGGCLYQNSCVNTTSIKSVSSTTTTVKNTTVSDSTAGSCRYSCSTYNYTEGLCNQGWQCSSGCITYNRCVNSSSSSSDNPPVFLSVSYSPNNPTDKTPVTFSASASDDLGFYYGNPLQGTALQLFIDGSSSGGQTPTTLKKTMYDNTTKGAPLSTGTHSFYYTATDTGGHTSKSQTYTFVVSSTNATSSGSVAGSCQYSCSAYNYTEGRCNQGWQCSNGCITYNACVNATSVSTSTVQSSSSSNSCNFSCSAYKYTEGLCYQGWQCVNGCVTHNSCTATQFAVYVCYLAATIGATFNGDQGLAKCGAGDSGLVVKTNEVSSLDDIGTFVSAAQQPGFVVGTLGKGTADVYVIGHQDACCISMRSDLDGDGTYETKIDSTTTKMSSSDGKTSYDVIIFKSVNTERKFLIYASGDSLNPVPGGSIDYIGTSLPDKLQSTAAGTCRFTCKDYGYSEGQCYQGWKCSSGCVTYNSCTS